MGGASLDEPIIEGEGPKINGSIMVAVANTKEEVLEKIKSDIYATSGVWDESKVRYWASGCGILEPAQLGRHRGAFGRLTHLQIQIFPFKSALRQQLK